MNQEIRKIVFDKQNVIKYPLSEESAIISLIYICKDNMIYSDIELEYTWFGYLRSQNKRKID